MLEIVLVLLALFLVFLTTLPSEGVNLRWKTIRGMSKLPGPRGIPFFGMAIVAAFLPDHELLSYLTWITGKYERITAAWLLGVPMVLLKDAQDVEAVLGSVQHTSKGGEYGSLHPWLREGLLVSAGEKWHKRRKMLTPAFHFRILEDNLQSLNKHARLLLKNMLKKEGQPFIAEEIVTLCALDVICETAMGVSLNSQDNQGVEYVRSIKSVSAITVQRILKFWMRKELIFQFMPAGKTYFKQLSLLHNFTERIIRERKLDYQNDTLKSGKGKGEEEEAFLPKQRKAFLDSLLELDKKYPNSFTDLDIREEVDTFMFEGHDTTSAAIVFGLYLLGQHPDIMDKAYQEQFSIFGDSDRAVTKKDLHEMHYLEMVIKETLRLYPSVPYISRELKQDLNLDRGLVIPSGVNVSIIPYLIHREPKYFPNPEVFDPERFTLENCKTRHPFCYIPFSAGPRNCIGQKFAMMELKVILSTIVRFTKIESVTKKEDIAILPFLILRTKPQIQIKVTKRITEKSQ